MKSDTVKAALATLVVIGFSGVEAAPALAFPGVDRGLAAKQSEASGVEKTRWVCGPYRCWWRPNHFYYGGGPANYGWSGYGWGGGYGGWGGYGYGWRPRPYWW